MGRLCMKAFDIVYHIYITHLNLTSSNSRCMYIYVFDFSLFSAAASREEGEAAGAAGGGEKAAAVHLSAGPRCLRHSQQVPAQAGRPRLRRLRQGEDPLDPGDPAARGHTQERGGRTQVPEGVLGRRHHHHLSGYRHCFGDDHVS